MRVTRPSDSRFGNKGGGGASEINVDAAHETRARKVFTGKDSMQFPARWQYALMFAGE